MFLALALSFLVAGCGKKQPQTDISRLVTDTICPYTPVKEQGQSDACWIYAMLATIESEHIIDGDSINLSPEYVIFRRLMRQSARCYLTSGRAPISTRGTINMLPEMLWTDGVMPQDSYHSKANIHTTERKLASLTRRHILRRSGHEALQAAASDLLQTDIAPVPPHVYMYGAQYTPEEFAHSVCRLSEYVFLTSYASLPYNRTVHPPLADDHGGTPCLNVTLDDLIESIIATLRSGHPVCWEGDISEPGFDFQNGIARLDDGTEPTVSAEQRQWDIERSLTTDDHCMELIGLAHDRQGRQYVICKNSWGKTNRLGGLMYMSLPYLQMKTLAVGIRRSNLE